MIPNSFTDSSLPVLRPINSPTFDIKIDFHDLILND